MSNRFKHLGVRDDDAIGQRMAAQFTREAKQFGWSSAQIERAIQVCAANETKWQGMPIDEAWGEFQAQTSNMLSEENLDLAAAWHDDLVTNGLQPEPDVTERLSRLAELDEMAKDADGAYYTGAEAQELQREHLELLEGSEEIGDAEFESAASTASETLDEGVSENAFEQGGDDAADYGDIENGRQHQVEDEG